MKPTLTLFLALFFACAAAFAAPDLSPGRWSPETRVRVEALAQSPAPPAARVIEAKSGIVSATMSPIAVQAGLTALQQGGTAADAAATVALTQIATALGSYVSYAGLLQLTYYEAKTGRIHTLNAGWNTYRGETDPQTIPTATQPDGAHGRKTLVPGFMAGIEAMHNRFGRLPFAELFAPAIWYAEKGVTLSPVHASFFAARHAQLARTPEGRAFLHQAGEERIPVAGDRFVQTELAATLRAVAQQGARFMYHGAWAEAYVAAVRREGGKVTLEDLAAYEPIWEDALQTGFSGYALHTAGANNEGGYQLLQAINLLEALGTPARAPYWRNPQTLLDLSRVLQFTAAGPYVHEAVAGRAASSGTSFALTDRATKPYAAAAVPLLDLVFDPVAKPEEPKHSDAIVVVDAEGNVATLVHTINTVLWGSTGIVVGGVPISDAATFQQARLATVPPGGRVPNEMAPVIALKDGQPVLAIACIGSSLVPETVRLLLATLGQSVSVAHAMAAPPLLLNFDFAKRATILVPEAVYDAPLLAALRDRGINVETKSQQDVWTLQGTAVIGRLDAAGTGLQTVEIPTVFSFAAGY